MATQQRIGVFGGTFDPPHIGHLIAASMAHDAFSLHLTLFVPSGSPWQKDAVTPAIHRLAMMQKAISGDERFAVSDVDIKRSGATYAIDTVADLRSQYPDADFYWIMGADSFASLPTWKRWQEFADLVQLVVVNRPHSDSGPDIAVLHLDIPDVDVSATEIRDLIKVGRDCRYLVPQPALDYARENQLYGLG